MASKPTTVSDGFVFSGHADKLEGSAPLKGGLLFSPKNTAGTSSDAAIGRHVFKVPAARGSALGLDKLAHQKRQEKAHQLELLSAQVPIATTSVRSTESSQPARPYRKRALDTPSEHGRSV
ncbi:hypothetical protein BASA62_003208 [Batrachochytrium salamandrivorans]|nr:hypothetical protein BASA62_003208 [Batrachochytrium salamandrivorans]